MIELLLQLTSTIDNWLNKPYIRIDGLLIDRWSWVHLITGIVIGLIVIWKLKKVSPWKAHPMVFLILILWEIFERVMGNVLFKVETMTDKTWDMIIGFGGYYLIYSLYISKRKLIPKD
ncbi:hypothetical protein COT97_00770 [Candidatus Falkowbacteria bacterium CG10_big_fil_rev_8_21_14_0_10_39_11]|uniref:VanZ-like domain-containing protein n=1 Tax=Candidatus Falkowbacteria bacterium CG10_big_fil_rev_8_21_14_0_10_39_11 TaxID=1974565 RepID=A0A2H0V614_9BACT|nr:MAG: hypothetical protein COT97_00770 [Candidatus Falkowbacteria bacterium CG10_big_fil_rev_8_21_14_0_10_39_11]